MPRSVQTSWLVGSEPWPYVKSRGLVRLRAVTAGIQLGVCLVVLALPTLELPLRALVPMILLLAAANVATVLWEQSGRTLPSAAAGGVLTLEVLLLTGLLEITGGPFNPFCVIYGVQVVAARFTIGRVWGYITAMLAAAAYGVLVYQYLQPDLAPGHHRLNDFPTHLFTMWMAATATAELAGYFASRATSAIEQRQRELEDMRMRAARSERLAALTTLAAGAAHELSTPLGTIAVAARELERDTARLAASVPSALHEDAQLIRDQVERCHTILDQMSGRAGGTAADEVELVRLEEVAAEVKERLTEDHRQRLRVGVDDAGALALPRAGLIQVTTSLVRNAFEASTAQQTAWLELRKLEDSLRVTVRDVGAGVAPGALEHVGEPFFTTKDAGRGLGLGLFLARIFAERFGGSLTLASAGGTTVTLTLPMPIGRLSGEDQ